MTLVPRGHDAGGTTRSSGRFIRGAKAFFSPGLDVLLTYLGCGSAFLMPPAYANPQKRCILSRWWIALAVEWWKNREGETRRRRENEKRISKCFPRNKSEKNGRNWTHVPLRGSRRGWLAQGQDWKTQDSQLCHLQYKCT